MYYWKLEKSYSIFVQHIWDINKKNSPLKTTKYSVSDELEYAKKRKVVKISKFWDDPPPPVAKIHNIFFWINPSLMTKGIL